MKRTFTRANIARTLLLTGFLLFTFTPLYWMFITSIKPSDDYLAVPPVWFPGEPTIVHYTAALFAYRGLDGLINSLIVSIAATAASCFFGTLMAYSLARFNTALVADTPPPAWTGSYFTGVPAPAGAFLALVPLAISFEAEAAWPSHPIVVGIVLVAVGGLMVSRLPTFSFKKGRIPRHLVVPSLLVAALTMGVIASSPWIGLSLLGLIYLALIPYSWLTYRRQAARDRQVVPPSDVVPLRSVPTDH